jgi:hypothetical protein
MHEHTVRILYFILKDPVYTHSICTGKQVVFSIILYEYLNTSCKCQFRILYRSILLLITYLFLLLISRPITVAARFEARTVFAISNARIVFSNPTQGMDVCVHLFCICVVLCVGRGLSKGWFPDQGVLPNVYRFKKLKKRPRPNIKDCRAIDR